MDWPTDPLRRKTYGRIFVAKKEHVEVVKRTIEEVDAFEAGYMPSDVVAVFGDDEKMTYLHKFEICRNALAAACMAKGVWIWVVDGVREEF